METLYWFVSILFFICTQRANGETVWVTSKSGKLGGLIEHFTDEDANFENDVIQFLGVPFAKPPLGPLRFQRPIRIKTFPKTLKFNTWPNACVQYTQMQFPWAMLSFGRDFSEDCLYLNMWVPKDASLQNKKSVLFWIHGGGFSMGSNRQEIYDGQVMAAIGDVIVVTTNYRLGSFGFWSNNDTTAPGNVGIYDVIAALRWVRNNIESFGGDPDSITIAGQGAGAVIVSLLSITRKKLYKRSIMQSGSAMWTLMDDNISSLERSYALAERLGCAKDSSSLQDPSEDVAECMRGIDAQRIVEAEMNLNSKWSSGFLPKWGDELFRSNPRKTFLRKDYAANELLIGISGNEGAFKITTANPGFFGFFGMMQKVLTRSQSIDLLENSFPDFEYQDELVQHYMPALVDHSGGRHKYQLEVANALGDYEIVCPTMYFALLAARSGAKVYYYDFQHRPDQSVWAEWMGTTHFDEVDFVFGGPFKSPETYSKSERNLSRMMIQHWTNFVKYGKPNDEWPEYGKYYQTMLYKDANETCVVVGPHIGHCKFWRPYFDHKNKMKYPEF